MDGSTLAILGAIAVIALPAGIYMDKGNVRKAARRRGWEVQSVEWRVFPPGRWSSDGYRHYLVRYREGDSLLQTRHCFVSSLSDVTWTD